MNNRAYSFLNVLYSRGNNLKKPLFIAGTGRSGTTWIGNTIKQSPGILYYNEPCNPSIGEGGEYADWFKYVSSDGNHLFYYKRLSNAFEGLISDGHTWLRNRALRRFFPDCRPVIKDVAPLLSIEWVCKTFNPIVLIVLRHPCAVVLSEFKKKTPTENAIDQILAQEKLVHDHLKDYVPSLENLRSPLEIYAAIYAVRYRIIYDLLQKEFDFKTISYEALCGDPLKEFKNLFEIFDLTWNRNVERFIFQTTTMHKSGTHSISRVTSKQINKWKGQMKQEDINAVRSIMDQFELPFYNSESDWATV